MFNKESNYLKRTAGPKYSNYISDGCGRDKYILINNGGIERRSASIQLGENYPGRLYDFNCVNKDKKREDNKIDWAASNME